MAGVVVVLGASLSGPGVASAEADVAGPAIAVSPLPITPYTSGGCQDPARGCYRVYGYTQPNARLTITVRDQSGYTVTAEARALARDDPGTPENEEGYWAASPNITNLERHDEVPSFLTFSAIARDADGTIVSQASVSEVEKRAVTPGDSRGPKITLQKTPPGVWCHTGIGLGCNSQCIFGTVLSMVSSAPPAIPPCSAPEAIAGIVEDAHSQNFGIGSEIRDVTIQIRKFDDESYLREFHSFLRRGTDAAFGVTVGIQEFEPGDYEIRVSAVDAAGNAGEDQYAEFTVAFT